ncbi:Hypothetical Protein FCC1311_000032 [Hondaea fermentalgiana]|uniref:Uncharacterized protein n=1 Tax=Hondaea fermentalgiana TaxID=2315210 RepID=A0A2R5G5R2_9STRA|nr:Hypothetical Protein FCC1311_000032 [Hondaea fermentalgiana]|eukprot:GBG23783.1 Hypothetical Protein FCC1311_000032 [Hondaea fermentalgiana]
MRTACRLDSTWSLPWENFDDEVGWDFFGFGFVYILVYGRDFRPNNTELPSLIEQDVVVRFDFGLSDTVSRAVTS